MNKPGIYIHIPFCKEKCPYCDFYSISCQKQNIIEEFIYSLGKEIFFYQNLGKNKIFDTIYIGGGSPDILNEKQIFTIVKNLYSTFKFSSDTEFTIELNPQNITREKIMFLKDIGVNRISLGVQSLDEKDLKFLCRHHSVLSGQKAIEIIRSLDMALNIDLIYALPYQTKKMWLKILNDAVICEPQHISAYQLTIKDNTPFGIMKMEKSFKESSEKKQAELFFLTSDFLEEKGFIHYEVSNFAINEKYFCRHNMKYWQRIFYLGLGPSAHSFFNEERWSNYSDVEKYCSLCKTNILPMEKKEKLTKQQTNLEKIYLGFRTKMGISEKDLYIDNTEKIVEQLENQGFINIINHQIIPTKKGFLFSGGLPFYFI
jgi:oxygen-independent coproporphyrinogen-3 oxidase